MGTLNPVVDPEVRTDAPEPDDPALVVVVKVPSGGDGTSEQFDFTTTANVIYVGYAPRGSDVAQPVWVIKKITFDSSGNPLSALWSGNGAIWNDRVTTIYA